MPKEEERQPDFFLVNDKGEEIPIEALARGIKELVREIARDVNEALEGTGDGVMVDTETLDMSYPPGSRIEFRAIDESGREIIKKGTVTGVIPPILVYNPNTHKSTLQREAFLDVEVAGDEIKYGVGLDAIISPNQA